MCLTLRFSKVVRRHAAEQPEENFLRETPHGNPAFFLIRGRAPAVSANVHYREEMKGGQGSNSNPSARVVALSRRQEPSRKKPAARAGSLNLRRITRRACATDLRRLRGFPDACPALCRH